MGHLHVSEKLAAGLRSLPDVKSSFASTQAAWRFYRNALMCGDLSAPLIDGSAYWSMANFGKHQSKLDRKQRTHKNDIGYELQTALLLNDRNGEPLAPIVQNVVTSETSVCAA